MANNETQRLFYGDDEATDDRHFGLKALLTDEQLKEMEAYARSQVRFYAFKLWTLAVLFWVVVVVFSVLIKGLWFP